MNFSVGMQRRGIARAGRRACMALAFLLLGIPAAQVQAAPVETVSVSVKSVGDPIPESVAKRISVGIEAIGGRVLIGKEENIFKLRQAAYDKVLSDIVNRVVVGYVVSDLEVRYGKETHIDVSLTPVGRMVESVETIVDYGNLSPLARRLVEKDAAGISEKMAALLVGLPVDSVGWAESVSQSAGRDVIRSNLPEFEASFDVKSSEHTIVRVSLVPQGDIVRTARLTFRETTIPRVLLLRAVNDTERLLRELEGLPVAFLSRHRKDIEEEMQQNLQSDFFIKRYGIEIRTELVCGRETELKTDALTDHWLIQTQGWFDVGRDGNRNTMVDGVLGHFLWPNDLLFGEARFYPGPFDGEIYGGYAHRFGKSYLFGYKYDFTNKAGHLFGSKKFGDRWVIRFDRDLRKKVNEYGVSYRLHNYLALEYVYHTQDGKWLRLIANL